jgi:hypothetical protein
MLMFMQVSTEDSKQLQLIALKISEEIDAVKAALADKKKLGAVKLPFELYKPFRSLPIKIGE